MFLEGRRLSVDRDLLIEVRDALVRAQNQEHRRLEGLKMLGGRTLPAERADYRDLLRKVRDALGDQDDEKTPAYSTTPVPMRAVRPSAAVEISPDDDPRSR